MRRLFLIALLGLACVNARPCNGECQEVLAVSKTSSATPAATVNKAAIVAALKQAGGEVDRLNILLPNPADPANITFTFINNTVSPPTGGTVALATVDVFPALVGTNVAMAIGFINACGLNVPHSHPRANEFLTVVQGKLQAGFILEGTEGGAGNVPGANPASLVGPLPEVNTTLTPYTGTLFPQGTVHFQFNPTCEPAVFAAAFDSNDPGRTQTARSFFSIEQDSVLRSSLGSPSVETINAKDLDSLRAHIPTAFAELIDSCVARCRS
ncbi:MAG: hypothetical protein MMC33_010302 [Icmadophila ericetorum]|nr:hypothetical protein [Icmadophila ericetorum]